MAAIMPLLHQIGVFVLQCLQFCGFCLRVCGCICSVEATTPPITALPITAAAIQVMTFSFQNDFLQPYQ
jgi:hypothetical protein